jgi:hypothetical protein
MADTIREKLIKALKTRLEGYLSFVTLSGATVYRGLLRFQETIEDLPVISIVPREEVGELQAYGESDNAMEINIYAVVALGTANPSELAEAVFGELLKAVFSGGDLTGSKAFIYTGGGPESYPDELGQPVMTIKVSVAVGYATDHGDPYNLTT